MPLQTIIDIIILERADLDSLILWCVYVIVTVVQHWMRERTCADIVNFNLKTDSRTEVNPQVLLSEFTLLLLNVKLLYF